MSRCTLFVVFRHSIKGRIVDQPFKLFSMQFWHHFWTQNVQISGSCLDTPKKTVPRWPRIALGAVQNEASLVDRARTAPESRPNRAQTGIFRRPGPPGKPTIKEEQLKNTPPKMRTGLTRPGPQAWRIVLCAEWWVPAQSRGQWAAHEDKFVQQTAPKLQRRKRGAEAEAHLQDFPADTAERCTAVRSVASALVSGQFDIA